MAVVALVVLPYIVLKRQCKNSIGSSVLIVTPHFHKMNGMLVQLLVQAAKDRSVRDPRAGLSCWTCGSLSTWAVR